MGIKFKNDNIQKKYEYYKNLGLTVGQSLVLSINTYSDYTSSGIEILLEAYKNSKFLHDGVTFSQLYETAYNDCDKKAVKNDPFYSINSKLIDMLGLSKQAEILKDTLLVSYKKSRRFGGNPVGFSSFGGFGGSPVGFGGFGGSPVGFGGFGGSNNPFHSIGHSMAATCDALCEDTDYDDCDDECVDECDEFYESECCCDSLDDYENTPVTVSANMLVASHNIIGNESVNTSKHLVNTLDFEENREKQVISSPTSTFKASCSKVAMDLLRAGVKSESDLRLEEIINYPKYNLGTPENKFKVVTEVMRHPDDNNKQLLFIGAKGNELIPKRQNVVVLLDVSGSMHDNVETTQMAIATLISKLNIGDKFSLITYSDTDTVVIDDITINENSIDFIIERLLSIEITGCTYGSKGLYSAYQLIHKNKIEDGVNRIVLLTDGDFNFSLRDVFNIAGEVEDIVLAERDKGAYISVVGCGRYLDDKIMSTVARNGNGNYCIIYDLDSVDRNINKAYNELMHAIAKDVKIQVEFNPAVVAEYKLFGYETRALNHEDFKNNKIIAEPFGSGAHAVALYELTPVKNAESVKSDLKYQKVELTDTSELCTVSLRYKDAESEDIKQIDTVVENNVNENTDNCKIAYRLVRDKDDTKNIIKYIESLEVVQ